MGDRRPKIQYQLSLAFMTEGRGEAPDAGREGTESPTAKREPENPAIDVVDERPRQPLNLIEPPWYGPVRPVVWEGRSREAPPYPDPDRTGSGGLLSWHPSP